MPSLNEVPMEAGRRPSVDHGPFLKSLWDPAETIGFSFDLGLSRISCIGGRSPMHSIVRSKGQSHMIENSSIPQS
jgi:hypothetical protein